jgi:hypothetical protein
MSAAEARREALRTALRHGIRHVAESGGHHRHGDSDDAPSPARAMSRLSPA